MLVYSVRSKPVVSEPKFWSSDTGAVDKCKGDKYTDWFGGLVLKQCRVSGRTADKFLH